MASITNISTTSNVTLKDNLGTSYTIAPQASITIINKELDYANFAKLQDSGLITVTGWVMQGATSIAKVTDSTGAFVLDPQSLPNVLTYNGPNGMVDTITVGPDTLGNYYRQTLTYTSTNLTGVSAWVKQ